MAGALNRRRRFVLATSRLPLPVRKNWADQLNALITIFA